MFSIEPYCQLMVDLNHNHTMTKESIYQIVYISSAIKSLTAEEMEQLADTSCENNVQYAISGLLLYVGGNFLQVIEGPREEVERLFENIKDDPRHGNIIKLIATEAESRMFPDWSMAFKTMEKVDLHTHCDHHSLLEIAHLPRPQAHQKINILLNSFLSNQYR